MDPVTAGFYGVVCGALAGLAPRVGRQLWARVAAGVAVGVVAAAFLPWLRGMMTGY